MSFVHIRMCHNISAFFILLNNINTDVTSGIGISKSLYNIHMYYILQFMTPGVVVYIIHYTADHCGIYCIQQH